MESLMNTPERITLNFSIEHDGVPYQYLVAPAGGVCGQRQRYADETIPDLTAFAGGGVGGFCVW